MTADASEAVEDLEALRERMLRLRVQNAALHIAARHHNLLSRSVFEELSDVVAKYTNVGAMALIVRDGPAHIRIYAASKGTPDFAVMGARLPQSPENIQTIHFEGRTLFRDDTRSGTETDRMLAKAGLLSYVELPVRPSPQEPVLAGLVFGFREEGGARAAPLPILQDVAEVIGANMLRAMDAARDRRLAMILETSGDAMISWDKDNRITDANTAAGALAGRPRQDLIGMPILSLLVPLSAAGMDEESGPQGLRMQLVTPSGRRTVAATITAVEDDPLVFAHVLLRDQAEVVKAEEAAEQHLAHIRRLEEQHRAVLDNAPLIIFRLDPTTLELVYLNGHAERLLGVPMHEAMSTPGFLRKTHADPDSVADFEHAVQQAREGREATPYEARLRRRNGDEITAQGNVYPMLGAKGDVIAIEGVLADVSSEQAARSRLVQADRLSTLGTLAAGVAHEINNPAAFVLLGIDMLDRLLQSAGKDMAEGPRSQAGTLIRDLRDSVRRIVDIARDLRLFASAPGDGGRRTFIDVNRAVESALTLTRGHIIDRAQIQRDLGDVPPVLMDDSRLGQVIVNLLVNATQAIPKPGSVPSTRSPPGDAAHSAKTAHTISVATRLKDDDVLIEVTDTGVGIAPENLNRIWTPFFTTKTPEVGTGLGLSISRDIIERAGGTITVESPAPGTGRGTRFTIVLPVARGPMPSAGRRMSTPPLGRPILARAQVLIVEDEPALARALAEGIGRVHEVRVVSRAHDALELLVPATQRETTVREAPITIPPVTLKETAVLDRPITIPAPSTLVSGRAPPKKPRFDVVLCDLRMPGMSGEALYKEVKAHDEAQASAFIFMTGVGFGADVERFLRDAGRPVLEKPFATDAALELIAKIVSKRS